MYTTSIGAGHMRTNSFTEATGLPVYEAIPPPEVKMLSEYLRINGYFCINNAKTDYQFKPPVTAWDENGPYAHWRNRKNDKPFFSIFSFNVTHESVLFEPYGFPKIETRHYNAGNKSFDLNKNSGKLYEEEMVNLVSKEQSFKIPPYLPQTEIVKRDVWKLYNNISEMDRQVGAILDQLENDALLEETIIFFYSDHGGPLPRQKRTIYDSGIRSPLIIRFPWKEEKKIDNQLISFIDLAPTVLSLAGIKPPSYMQGEAFLGKYKSARQRKYIHAAADRFDAYTDVIRGVRDLNFKYIRNFKTNQGYYLPIEFRENIPTMKELLKLRKKGELNEIQLQWFRDSKPKEELFNCSVDPHEIKNLSNDPLFQEKLTELRMEMDRWLITIGDNPEISERNLVSSLWNGREVQPITKPPVIKHVNGGIMINCDTDGASIGYRIFKDIPSGNRYSTNGDYDINYPLHTRDSLDKKEVPWDVYTGNRIVLQKGQLIQINAHRIGYKPSTLIYHHKD